MTSEVLVQTIGYNIL